MSLQVPMIYDSKNTFALSQASGLSKEGQYLGIEIATSRPNLVAVLGDVNTEFVACQ